MTAEDKAKAYAKKRIVLENRDKFSDEANLRAAEYYAYKAYLAGYNQGAKDLSENKFNPDDYVYRAVFDLIGEAQKEAYNQAIDDALEEIDDYKLEYDDFNDFSAGVSSILNNDKQSILKLKK